MSYKEASASCDWCSRDLRDGDDICCRKCHEALEQKVADLEAQIESLEDEMRGQYEKNN